MEVGDVRGADLHRARGIGGGAGDGDRRCQAELSAVHVLGSFVPASDGPRTFGSEQEWDEGRAWDAQCVGGAAQFAHVEDGADFAALHSAGVRAIPVQQCPEVGLGQAHLLAHQGQRPAGPARGEERAKRGHFPCVGELFVVHPLPPAMCGQRTLVPKPHVRDVNGRFCTSLLRSFRRRRTPPAPRS